MMRRLWIPLFVSALMWALRAHSQSPSYSPYLAGTQNIAVRDSVSIGGTTIDTSQAFDLSAPDVVYLFALYDSRADSINVIVYLDISFDTGRTHWKEFSGLDTCIVSGTGDSLVYKQLNPGVQFPYGARFGRLRVKGRMVASDSCRVTLGLTVTRLHLERLR